MTALRSLRGGRAVALRAARTPQRMAPRPALADPGTSAALALVTDKHYMLRVEDSVDVESLGMPVPTDFYELLGLPFDADSRRPIVVSSATTRLTGDASTPDSIKAAYRRLQKLAHPDVAGEAATELAALLNLAYTTLTDPATRGAYEEDLRSWRRGVGTYDGRPVSFWAGPPDGHLAVFVDETSCIGCTQCTAVAPDTFFMEEQWGRARVHTQWGDPEEAVREAVATCPVDCIHFVDRQFLPLLEYVMKGCHRECVALMGRRRSGNMGSAPAHQSPFVRAEAFVKARKRRGLVDAAGLGGGGGVRTHDDALAAAIGRAWLALPRGVRDRGWPHLSTR